MYFRDKDRQVREAFAEPFAQSGNDRVFRAEMVGVDKVDPQLERLLKLMVLDVGRDIPFRRAKASRLR